VDQLCGRIEYVERIPSRKHPDNYSEKRTGLTGLTLDLYVSRDGASCCVDSKRVGTTTSGRGARFDFKPVKEGDYWVSTTWKGKQYNVPVSVGPPTLAEHCSFEGIAIDEKGNAFWFAAVTVD
jgi:hypothetical protein